MTGNSFLIPELSLAGMNTLVAILIIIFILGVRKVDPPARKNISTILVKSNPVIEFEIINFPAQLRFVPLVG